MKEGRNVDWALLKKLTRSAIIDSVFTQTSKTLSLFGNLIDWASRDGVKMGQEALRSLNRILFFSTVFLLVPFKLYLTQSVNGNRSYSINFSDVQFLISEKFLWSPPVLIHY